MDSGVTLITPTGGRPQAFELCRHYVARQQTARDLQWIVVDDGEARTAYPNFVLRQSLIWPEPRWKPGQNTLARNLLAAIPEIRGDRILILEDDDHYPPGYVDAMANALDHGLIAGCQKSNYYHLPSRQFRVMHHPGRSSLFHTGFRRELLPVLAKICLKGPRYVDVDLWESVEPKQKVFFAKPLATGIKGMPGRPGIGIGHRPEVGGDWQPDFFNLNVLRSWIGEDLNLYAGIIGH